MKTKTMVMCAAGVALIAALTAALMQIGSPEPQKSSAIKSQNGTAPSASPEAKRRGAEGSSAAAVDGSATSWTQRFEQSENLAQFVSEASAAADNGDADAAWHVADAMKKCGLVITSLRKGGTEQDYQALVTSQFTTREQSAAFSATFRRCQALATDPAFADWEQRSGGKMLASYWEDLARDLNSPKAKAAIVIEQGSNMTAAKSAAEKAERASQLRATAREVVRSRDPEALFTLGTRLANADMSKDPTYGFALALAACDLGYDCTGRNAKNLWSACDPTTTCTPERSFRNVAEEMLSPQQYAAADALAEQYKDALARGMFSELDRFVALDGSSFQN